MDTYVDLLGGLAQGCVVLLNEIPANFILGKVLFLLLLYLLLGSTRVLIVVNTVGRHRCSTWLLVGETKSGS